MRPPRIWWLFLLLTATAAHAATDIDIGWISRHPEIDYVVNSSNPRIDGWPAAGDPVTWRAHVRNWSTQSRDITYDWLLDGSVIASGSAHLAADAYSEIDVIRPWTFERHELTFRINGGRELAVFTDAIAVGFWVEQSFYDFMRANQPKLAGIDSASFEDWAQRHIAKFNDMAQIAIYPETPNGVRDRWRLQKVVIVPDGALPLVPVDPKDGSSSSHPDDADRTIDLSWGFPASASSTFTDLTTVSPFNSFYLEKSLVHELGHARYLIDVYGYSVKHVPPTYRIEITENGNPVVNNLMPATGLIFNGVQGYTVYETADSGLMVYDYDWIDRHSAAAMNLIAGARAVDGTANVPKNYAVYLNDLPAQNRITLRDGAGNPVPDADVDIFQGARANDDLTIPDSYLSRVYDNVPDLHFHSDANGQILVGRNPFTSRGALDGYREGELTAILRVRANGKTTFGFLESRSFNLAYWRGLRDLADHDVYLGIRCSEARANLDAPAFLAKVNSNIATLKWQSVTDASSYTVWVSIDGRPPEVRADHTFATSLSSSFTGRVQWWVEAHYNVACPSRRSLTYEFTAPPAPSRHRAVRQH